MRMLNQFKINNKIKKSHILLFGSFLVFIGVIAISWNYFLKMREEVYSDMKISMMDVDTNTGKESKVASEVPVANNVPVEQKPEENIKHYEVDYSKYLGVLEIPKIGLKRGFYNTDSRYNNIQYNVTLVSGSDLPDVVNGNLILMAHSGDAYISFFAYLYKLNIGDYAYVTYNGVKYQYQIVNIYNVPKTGLVKIERNHSRTTLTMITCTKNNNYSQTIYIAELIN